MDGFHRDLDDYASDNYAPTAKLRVFSKSGAWVPAILYAEDFDAPPAPEPSVPLAPVFDAQDIADARDAGYRAGLEAARTEQAAIDDALRLAALQSVADTLGSVRTEARLVAEAAAADVAAAIFAALTAALPSLCAQHAEGELAALLEMLLPAMAAEPVVKIVVEPSLAGFIEAKLAGYDSEFAGQIAVQPDARLTRGDIRMTWRDGRAIRDQARLWRDITAILSPFMALASPARTHQEHTDGE